MKKVDESDAFPIGWYVSQLLDRDLRVVPVVEDGVYTDTVEWYVKNPQGRHVTIRLTIDPKERT